MREVQLLARLNHSNIVRYYSSWFELDSIVEENKTAINDDQRQQSTTTSPRLNIREIINDDEDESLTNAHYKSTNGNSLRRNQSWPSTSAIDSAIKVFVKPNK